MVRRVLRNLKKSGKVECLAVAPEPPGEKRVLPLKEGKREGNKTAAVRNVLVGSD